VVKLRRIRWLGHVEREGDKRNTDSVLVGKPGGKKPLGRPRRRRDDNIKVYLQGVGWESVD
jgi:hypothetical protein